MILPDFHISNKWVLDKRGLKNVVDSTKPYAYSVEKERTADGGIEDVATIFLTNRECPFRCLMCDLWKNTINSPVLPGAIPRQIEYALERLPTVRHVKLYNSGNFFDPKAIPPEDHVAIAELLDHMDTVLVENHPKLMDQNVLEFRDTLKADLQVAIGLETIHPQVLPLLNKQMTPDDFRSSVRLLSENEILSRAFILLRPPFLDEVEGVQWARKSLDFAFDAGIECCVIIPTRTGNGAMDTLESDGYFQPPAIQSLEEVLEYGISLNRGRVFADLWDLRQFSTCDKCFTKKEQRLHRMNLEQQNSKEVSCTCQ